MKSDPVVIYCQVCHIRIADMTRNGKGANRFGNTYLDSTCVQGLGLGEFYERIESEPAKK